MNTSIGKNKNLEGKKVIVLGGSSGLGFATAQAAATSGAHVVIVSSNRDRINQALSQLPGEHEGHTIDLRKEEDIRRFFEQTGSFDHLVYTAGESLHVNDIAQTEIDKAREFFNVRYWGAFAAVKYSAPHINAGGSICLTSGLAGTRPWKGWSVVSSVCSAMEGLTRALAVELAPVRVNCVVSGLVKTNLWNDLPETDRAAMYDNVGRSLPVGRVGEADDLARAFLYLMEQSFSTGGCLVVDGGGVLV